MKTSIVNTSVFSGSLLRKATPTIGRERREMREGLTLRWCRAPLTPRPDLASEAGCSSIMDRGLGIIESYNFHVKIIFIQYHMKKYNFSKDPRN